MNIKCTWAELKTFTNNKNLLVQYTESANRYFVFAIDSIVVYSVTLQKDSTEATEFVDDYKPNANKSLIERNDEGREVVMTTSRPKEATTFFTSSGDKTSEPQAIGDGVNLFYDFSNNDNDITPPSGYKRKRIEIEFIDPTWIKEGTAYFHNAKKGSYVDLFIVCPSGEYYVQNDGTPVQATEDTVIEHFCNKLFMQGDCPMGDELNTESCSKEIPAGFKYRMEITVPDTDTNSNGYFNLELYRTRTAILE